MIRRLLLIAALLPVLPAAAQMQVSRLFADGMVMQRGMEVPVWGWAEPGTEVTVSFEGEPFAAIADGDSTWRVVLPAREAGGPFTMTLTGGGETRRVGDIWIGDVWVASGQSNMEWPVAESAEAAAEIAAGEHPLIRHFNVPWSWAERPAPRLAGGAWQVATPEHVGQFSAVGYYFARALRTQVDVPIGLLNATWGGSRLEPWMSQEALGLSAAERDAAFAAERDREAVILDRIRARIGTLPTVDAGLAEGLAHWAAPDFDDGAWVEMPVPAVWEAHGFEGLDGVGWYRTTFTLSEAEAQQGVTLGLGMIDDSDIAWVNGTEVGRTDNAWNQARLYAVPPAALRPGTNVLAVRVEDFLGGGGIAGPKDAVFLEAHTGRRALPAVWRFTVGRVTIGTNGSFQKNQVPTLLWNKMIHPLLPFPIKGVLWYQGESNASNAADAVAYERLFQQMIRHWRAAWGQGDFPFLWVQLANFMEPDDAPPAESHWATLRAAQHAALALPHTAQAVIIDIGEADDIHPRNKQDVGRRLARAARHVAYGENLVYAGPVYRSHEVRDGQVWVRFEHVGGGLETPHGASLGGFAVAGAEGRFVWAEARIEGDQVVVWSDAVPVPAAVRYAWGNNPARANLYNAEGLPAAPFRTDAW